MTTGVSANPVIPVHPHAASMRRLFLTAVTGSFVFLIPWIAYLSVSLPSRHEVNQWDIAWVGFDFALVACIGVTALCAWRRRQIFIPWAMITATLLVCDAWFDIVLDWNTPDLWSALLTAAVGELPLAALLFFAARRLLRLTIEHAWILTGHTGPAPQLSRLELLASARWLQPETQTVLVTEQVPVSDVDGRTGIDAAHGARNGVAQGVDPEA